MDRVVCSSRSREILREYDQNRNIAFALTAGQNIEMLKLLDLLDQLRQRWNYENRRVRALEEENRGKDREIAELQKQLRLYKEQLRDARAQIKTLMSDNKEMEHYIGELERNFELVKDLLKDQSVLSDEERLKLFPTGNTFSKKTAVRRDVLNARLGISHGSSDGEEIDYDKTADTMDTSDDAEESRLRNGKVYRRSRSLVSLTTKRASTTAAKRSKKSVGMDTVEEESGTPRKRSKGGTEMLITTTATVTVDAEGKKPPTAKIAVKRSMDRSISAANILNTEDTVTVTPKMLTSRYGTSVVDVRTPLAGTKTWTHGASIESRQHTFVGHNSILGAVIGDHCEVCNGGIGIGRPAYKCCDCGIHIHRACTANAPVPCVPRTPTPRTPGKQRPRLKDFCPSAQPMIPPIIIHCILALEKDRLSSEGIYRVPGNDILVQKLLSEFQNGRTAPKLEYHDTETITSCVKQFLNKLRDPIIPATSWKEFVSAAEADDMESLNRAVMDLPYPNRDTLAFLCAHFQKVSDNCVRNRMPPNVLARCVAATVVGPAPAHAPKGDEEAKQVAVMLALLRMPRDYWPKFYNFDNGMPLIRSPQWSSMQGNGTPLRTPYKNPNQSILGPVETPPSGKEQKMSQLKLSKRKRLLGDML